MKDPTYNLKDIKENPEWDLAFALSEIRNDGAPLGWGSYIITARCLLSLYDIKPKKTPLKKRK